MVPRTVNAAAHPCFRGLFRCMVPRISCPYRLHVATRHGAARAAKWSRRLCVVPRTPWCRARQNASSSSPVLPRNSTCGRAPMVPRAAERFVLLAYVAAQLYMLPRSSMCCRAPMVPRAAERFVSLPMLPRSGLDCYKMAVSSTVMVSRSTAVVEVGRRIVVESVVRQPWWRLVVVG